MLIEGFQMQRQGADKGRNRAAAAMLLTALALASGCQVPDGGPVAPPRVLTDRPAESAALPRQYRIMGWSVEKRPVMLQVFGDGEDVTFILAGIHGDESAGITLVRRLGDYLDRHANGVHGKTILLLPVANPDGQARVSRENARSVDLNRNFPADNRAVSPDSGRWALSEPETRVIHQIIREYRPKRVVSVHQPLGCVDYDGPAADLADRMAQACGLPVKQLGTRPGSLGSYSSQIRGIPIVTLELLDSDSGLSDEQLWARYGKALLVAIQ